MTSKCPSCPNTSFEIVTAKIHNAGASFEFIQCSKCGSVVGVVDSVKISAYFDRVQESIKQLSNKVEAIAALVQKHA